MINLHRFDLMTLRLYMVVVDAGSLTAGSRSLGLSLAAASKRVAELEQHCGVTLLVRSKRGVTPTPAGQSMYHHAVDVVARLQHLALAMDDFRSGATGQLRLWANNSAFAGFLPRLLADYTAAHPGVSVDLEDALSEESVRAVLSGVAELAIIGENTPLEGLSTQVCDVDELVLIMPPGHALDTESAAPVPLATVLDHDFVSLARSTSLMRRIAAEAEAINRPVRIRIQVRSFDAMCHMVSVGLGLAILPRAATTPHLAARALRLRPLGALNTQRRLLLAMRSQAMLSGPAQALVDMVATRAASLGFTAAGR
ncbi:MAG: LysR family transcriptional regulator [Burkholderiaceae bacterium]|nr:LysR family transcriptional regulator [Burkholderiaceae bacterium]